MLTIVMHFSITFLKRCTGCWFGDSSIEVFRFSPFFKRLPAGKSGPYFQITTEIVSGII
jgi:hypothetical protein